MYWYPEKPFRRCPTANSHNPLRALLKTAEHFEDIRYRQLKCLITVTTLVDSFLDRGFAFVVFVRLGNENLDSNGSFHNQKGNNLQQWSFGFQHSRSCLLFKMPPAGDPCQMSGSPPMPAQCDFMFKNRRLSRVGFLVMILSLQHETVIVKTKKEHPCGKINYGRYAQEFQEMGRSGLDSFS